MPSETGSHTQLLRTPLPGEFWGVTAYFNPSGSPVLKDNLLEFSDAVRRQGLKLLVVEQAFGDLPFELSPKLCDLLVQRRSSAVLWQKERLLNVGFENLPQSCDKAAWLDADLLFENQDWVRDSARQLESHVAVQPFEQAVWLPRNRENLPVDLPRGLGEGCYMPGMAAVMSERTDWRRALADYFEHGHCGFAWAIRREVLHRHPLYDRHVLGGGDVTLAHAFYGDEDYWRGRNYSCRGMTKAEVAAIAAWSRGIHADIQSSVAAVPGRVLHLWHGAIASRSYLDRALILKENDFDPATDVAIDAEGCLCWNSDKPDLHRRAEAYFTARGHHAQSTQKPS